MKKLMFDVVTVSGNKIGSVIVDDKGGTLAMPLLDDFIHCGTAFDLKRDPLAPEACDEWPDLAVGGNPICPCCGHRMIRFQWYEVDPLYDYWYCMPCDIEGRTPFLRARFNGVWMK